MESTLLSTALLSSSLQSSPVSATATPPVFVDISPALSFSDAQRLLTTWLKLHPAQVSSKATVALDCGSLVLTGKMLSKLLETLRQQGLSVTMVYARLSQTQQAGLSCGLGVKEYPPASEEGLSSDGYAASPLVMSSSTLAANRLAPSSLSSPEEVLSTVLEPLAINEAINETINEAINDVIEETIALPLNETLEGLVTLQTTVTFNEKSSEKTESALYLRPDLKLDLDLKPNLEITLETNLEPMPLVSLNSDVPKSLSERGAAEVTAVEKPEWLEAPTVTHYKATAADTLLPEPVTGAEAMPTRLVTGTLRSGQTVVSEGHLLVMGDVHSGSEIIARGHIVVWGELRGVAHAGAPLKAGDSPQQWASIRALLLRAVQLRIGSTIARRPDRTSNHKPESPTDRSWHPEFARMVDGEIRIQADVNPGHSIDFL